MQVWIGRARLLQLLKLLVLVYLAGNARAFAVDVTLTWDPNSEPTIAGYNLHYGIASRSYGATIAVGNKTSYTMTGLPGGTYYFAVTAYDTSGNESGYSDEVSNGVPPTPTSLDLRVTGASAGSVSLAWNKTADPAATDYNLYWGTSSGTYSNHVDLGLAVTSHTFTGLTPGATYYFAIAYDTATAESDHSNEVSQTVPAVACTYSISPLSQSFGSAGGTGSAAVASSAACGWSAVSNAAWIAIAAGSNGGGNGTVTYTVDTNNSSSSRTGTLTMAGQTFTVTQAGTVPPTSTSFDLRVTGTSAESVSLAWNKTADPAAVNYNLYRGTSSGNYTSYADLNVATASYTFTGLTPGVTYYFAIAYDTWAGESGYSNEVSQTVPAATTSFNLRVTAASAGSVSLTWNRTTDPAAVNYNLYRGTSSGDYTSYADLNVATTSYTVTGLTPGVTYYFAIAYDTWAGESDYSDEVSQTVPAEF